MVRSYSKFWVNCADLEIPAYDSDLDNNSTTNETTFSNNNFQLPTEDLPSSNEVNKGRGDKNSLYRKDIDGKISCETAF